MVYPSATKCTLSPDRQMSRAEAKSLVTSLLRCKISNRETEGSMRTEDLSTRCHLSKATMKRNREQEDRNQCLPE